MPRKKSENLTTEQDRFVRMEANGYNGTEIIQIMWGLTRQDEGFHAAEQKLSRWRQHPKYEEVWKDEVRKQDYGDYSEARKTLRRTMRNEKDQWLAMNSAVNIINQSGKRIFGAEDNAITVKIEGSMPDIGSPDENA